MTKEKKYCKEHRLWFGSSNHSSCPDCKARQEGIKLGRELQKAEDFELYKEFYQDENLNLPQKWITFGKRLKQQISEDSQQLQNQTSNKPSLTAKGGGKLDKTADTRKGKSEGTK